MVCVIRFPEPCARTILKQLKIINYLVKLNLAGTGMKVSKGGLTGTYEILQLHFHWSKAASDTGAEHQIDGKKYPLEVNLTFSIVMLN